MAIETATLKRVDLWSLFKIAFVVYAIMGFIAGLFYGMMIALLGSFGDMLGEELPGVGNLSGAIGVIAVPLLAMVYGVMGSLVVTIGGALYNLIARFVGGLKVTVEVADASGSASTGGPASI
jgi:hypothetical protein